MPLVELGKVLAQACGDNARVTKAFLDVVALATARISELEAENAALCRANTEERARRKAAEVDLKHRTGQMAEAADMAGRLLLAKNAAVAERDAALKRVAELEADCAGLAQNVRDANEACNELEAERLAIIRAHAIEGDHCEDDVVRAIVERLQSSIVGVVWQRDAARATVERVRECVASERTCACAAKSGCAWAMVEAALTPPGDGGVL